MTRRPRLVNTAAVIVAAAWYVACGDGTTEPPPRPPEPTNRGPVAVGTIPAQAVTVGETTTVSLSTYFSDPDGGRPDLRGRVLQQPGGKRLRDGKHRVGDGSGRGHGHDLGHRPRSRRAVRSADFPGVGRGARADDDRGDAGRGTPDCHRADGRARGGGARPTRPRVAGRGRVVVERGHHRGDGRFHGRRHRSRAGIDDGDRRPPGRWRAARR